ncbi:nuclear envelope-associated protein 2-like [Silene latifolia]|uniref:nuclear envelope-associated protein 2-like n=1 Tax=Silene latifolia TaxID=37657 RepID=UPI003D783D05
MMAQRSHTKPVPNGLDDLRAKLTITRAAVGTSAASAQSAQFQRLGLWRDLEYKDKLIMEHEHRVMMLAEQFDQLQKDMQLRESS